MSQTDSNAVVRLRRVAVCLASCALAGCANMAAPGKRLPFHVAVMPAVADDSLIATASDPAAAETGLQLVFDEAAFTTRLAAALGPHCCKVTRLPVTEDMAQSLELAQAAGADVILGTNLRYDRSVGTALNGRFWPNLALFAVGGPLSWFVSDRSYFYTVEFESQVHDVAIAATRNATLDAQSRLALLPGTSSEASLSFMERADGAGAYLLSLVLPAGFIGSESSATPDSLRDAVGDQLCEQLVQQLRGRSVELIGPGQLVDFAPADVRVVVDGGQRFLIGQFILDLGAVDDLGPLRYRFGGGEFREAAWGDCVSEPGGRAGRKRYLFRLPLDGTSSDFVQLEVEQLDAFASRRTFTFSTAETFSTTSVEGRKS